MKKLFFSSLLILLATAAVAAVPGSWKTYLAYHNNTFNVPAGKEIYSLCDGNLFVYDTETTEVRLLSKTDGLSGKDIVRMGYSATCKQLLLIYADATIDLLEPATGDIVTLPQLREAAGAEMEMGELCVSGDMAALGVQDGLVLIDMKRQELRGYYQLGERVYAAALAEGRVYAALGNTLIACNVSDNLNDRSHWTAQCTGAIRRLLPFGGRLFLGVERGSSTMAAGLWQLIPQSDIAQPTINHLAAAYYPNGYASSTEAVFCNATSVLTYTAADPGTYSAAYNINIVWNCLTRTSDGRFWASEGTGGLVGYKGSGDKLQATGDVAGGYGPIRDLFYDMKWYNGLLAVAGGRFDPYDVNHYPGTLMTYDGQDGWKSFQEEGISTVSGVPYRDMTSIVQDPADATHYFATSNTGLYEFRDYKLVKYYSNENSPLASATKNESVAKYFIRLDGLSYDANRNLWLVNNQTDTTLRVLLNDGTWEGFSLTPIQNAPTLEKTMFDTKGRIWVCSRRTVSGHDAGLLCFDFNGTIRNTSDDRYRYISSCYNQDGTGVTLNGVYAIIQDLDDAIWIGTGDGLFVVTDPEAWFDTDFTITQVKVPRNDGTNLADYLLDGISVSAIAIDGADRKWIGTNGSGLYLVSHDGTEILQHFTAADSPLLSDNIFSIAPNPETGEVMIATDAGLCSYQGEASAAAEVLEKSNVKVYPNPVAPDYDGPVVINGLTDNADVRIVNTAGQAVAGGRSNGGTFTWDVRGQSGVRVGSGIYYIMVSDADAKRGIVAKVAVVR